MIEEGGPDSPVDRGSAFTRRRHFGGLWIDQAAGGVVMLNLSSPDVALAQYVASKLPTGTKIAQRPVQSDLSVLDDQWAAVLAYAIVHPNVITSGENEEAGTVEMAFDDSTSDQDIAAARTELPFAQISVTADSYGAGLGRYDSGGHPVYGGSAIRNKNRGLGCTATLGGHVGSQAYLLTAGHCGHNGDAFGWGDSDRNIGSVRFDHYHGQSNNSTTCDCDLILLPTTPPGSVYVTGQVLNGGPGHVSQPAPYTYSRIGDSSVNDYRGGTRVCISGITSGTLCGTIQLPTTSYRNEDDGNTNVVGFSTSITMAKGDSGGPAGNGGTFLGLFSGGRKTGDNVHLANAICIKAYSITAINFRPQI